MGTGAREDAFERLVRDRSSAMKRTAYLLTGDHYLAEDLLQAALTKTYLRWGTLRDQGAAEAYVRRVMVSISTRWWQRRWHGERPTEVLPEGLVLTDEYAHADERSVTRALLDGLAPRQRAVVVLRFYEDLPERDVADLLGISVGTVKSTTAKALVRLRALAQGGCGPEEGR
jgi:RNA polymerase sigma-70 factor (sigma-E family)